MEQYLKLQQDYRQWLTELKENIRKKPDKGGHCCKQRINPPLLGALANKLWRNNKMLNGEADL